MTLSSADPNDADGLCTVIIAVLQKYRRELKPKGIENLAIGFAVYEVYMNFDNFDKIFLKFHKSIERLTEIVIFKVDDYRGRLGRSYFATNKSIARSAAFINLREVKSSIYKYIMGQRKLKFSFRSFNCFKIF